jgi:hypothetical protein
MKNRHALLVAALTLLPLLNATARADDPTGPLVCPILRSLAPGSVPGVVEIDSTGDVTIDGVPFWDCPPYGDLGEGGPRAAGHISIHRPPGQAPFLAAAPSAPGGAVWSCLDAHTAAPVMEGSTLSSPNPSVVCQPPAGFSRRCTSVQANGSYAGTDGSVVVTSACSGLSDSETLAPGRPGSAEPTFGNGETPWSCRTQENLVSPATTDYWAYCDVNAP